MFSAALVYLHIITQLCQLSLADSRHTQQIIRAVETPAASCFYNTLRQRRANARQLLQLTCTRTVFACAALDVTALCADCGRLLPPGNAFAFSSVLIRPVMMQPVRRTAMKISFFTFCLMKLLVFGSKK